MTKGEGNVKVRHKLDSNPLLSNSCECVAYNAPAEIIIICLSINKYLIVILVSMFAVRIS